MREHCVTGPRPPVPFWQPMLFAAMAGGMAWGIRGQYGHETGAMLAGLLVSLTLAFLLCRNAPPLELARAVAWTTVAMGFGGTMTYGQTLGLTQDPELVGNWAALRWGLLGCAIKGGVWIGFAGVFLGMGLGGVRYRPRELFWVLLACVAAYVLGVWLLNSPHNPAARELPRIYFSGDYYWWPDKPDLRPRPESWGGMWFALITTIVYMGFIRKDRLARTMALWGILGGALGFPLGQSLQAYHAWNLEEVFRTGFWADVIWRGLDPHMNWWNWMETTYGAIMGATLGLGLWLNRGRIKFGENAAPRPMPAGVEWNLLTLHVLLLAAAEFAPVPGVYSLYTNGLLLGILTIPGIAGGRWWPYLQIFPITLLPIAGKTVLELVYEGKAIAAGPGWTLYLIAPMVMATVAAFWLRRRAIRGAAPDVFIPFALLFNIWLYFSLNFAFFRFPWPWAEWTARTPNGIAFTICAIGLTAMAVWGLRGRDVEQRENSRKVVM